MELLSASAKSLLRFRTLAIKPLPKIYMANQQRLFTNHSQNIKNRSVLLYGSAAVILVGGLSYAAVPLYGIYCQTTGYGGTTPEGHDSSKIETMKRNPHRIVKVRFNADTSAQMAWNFKPQQHEIKLALGETALAFYSALNPTDIPIIGISTYNVVPYEAGPYFNKIQCFCFEEQRLNPHEEVDMPVFFYLDPEFGEDPKLEYCDEVILSYTFFESKPGLKLQLPQFR